MIEQTANALTQRGYICTVCKTAAEAKDAVLRIIGARSVGFGGSKTVNDMGIYDELKERGNAVYWHWKAPKEDKPKMLAAAKEAEVYICSSNAILTDGRMVNIDGTGNRVACLCYGPPCVIIVAGKNKICSCYEEAIERIKRDTCPGNARRLGLSTPCALTDVCTDCKGKARMCNVTVVSEYPTRLQSEYHVILVDEKLGL